MVKKTLVVVDMQRAFKYSEEAIDGCTALIKEFIAHKWPIIFLEWHGEGHTYEELQSLCDGYKNVYFATKDQRDGSREVMNIVESHRLSKHFVVCGCYTEQCVYKTVVGLYVRANTKPALVWDACSRGAGQFYCTERLRVLKKEDFYKYLSFDDTLDAKLQRAPQKVVKIVENAKEIT